MATGGTGDVLTGILAGLTAQFGIEDWARVLSFGIYLHGLAGDIAASRVGQAPLIASDLIEAIPGSLCACSGGVGTWPIVRRLAAVPEPTSTRGVGSHLEPTRKLCHRNSSEETIAKGREIAAKLRPPVLVLLSGDLGSGKTTLTKGIISGLGAAKEEDVTSPTFTLVHVVSKSLQGLSRRSLSRGKFSTIWNLWGSRTLFGEKAIVIIEWSERFHVSHGLAARRDSARARRRGFAQHRDLGAELGEFVVTWERTLRNQRDAGHAGPGSRLGQCATPMMFGSTVNGLASPPCSRFAALLL